MNPFIAKLFRQLGGRVYHDFGLSIHVYTMVVGSWIYIEVDSVGSTFIYQSYYLEVWVKGIISEQAFKYLNMRGKDIYNNNDIHIIWKFPMDGR